MCCGIGYPIGECHPEFIFRIYCSLIPTLSQIQPARVLKLDQVRLPASPPGLDLFLFCDSYGNIVGLLKPSEIVNSVISREFRSTFVHVLSYGPEQVSRDTCVEHLSGIGEHVDEVSSWRFAHIVVRSRGEDPENEFGMTVCC